MIKSISMRNVATFKDKEVKIDNMKEVNFIYGYNGSGKTTISNYLKGGENEDKYKDCNIEWESEYNHEKIVVFNKKFKEEYIFIPDDIKGIFTLGKGTKDDLENLRQIDEDLKKENESFSNYMRTLNEKKEEKERNDKNFKDYMWEKVYKKYSQYKEFVFKGFGKKDIFVAKVLEEFKKVDNNGDINIDEVNNRYNEVFKQETTPLAELNFNPNLNEYGNIETNEIWNTKIIGSKDIKIGKLIEHLENSDWVHKGKEYIDEESDVCPFCQQHTITAEFRKSIEDYFDTSYTEKINLVKDLKDQYEIFCDSITRELEVISNIINKDERIKNRIDLHQFDKDKTELLAIFDKNKSLIEQKIKEPSQSKELMSTRSLLSCMDNMIQEINKKVAVYNQKIRNIQKEKEDIKKSIWTYLLRENESEIKKYKETISGLEKAITNLESMVNEVDDNRKKLKEERDKIESHQTSIKPVVESMNKMLSTYGFTEFKISENGNMYQIIRSDGKGARESLSEGELNFVAFLYFAHLVEGSFDNTGVHNDKIIVIDDPVCSLDSNIMFVISAIIRNMMENNKKEKSNIKQIILLTHNVYFYKELSYMRRRGRKNIHYWILRKDDSGTSVNACGDENPINSVYKLLWDEYKRLEGKGQSINLQNIMRRILENYFGLKDRDYQENIMSKFDNEEDKINAQSLMAWLNEGSHTIWDGVEIQDFDEGKFRKTFENIFRRTGQIAHYNMMMEENLDSL